MNSQTLGVNTSDLEVTHISSHGVWILTHGKELFMPYKEFPWFKDQPVKAIIHVEEQSEGHLYWPDIDVDLTVGRSNTPTDSRSEPQSYNTTLQWISAPVGDIDICFYFLALKIVEQMGEIEITVRIESRITDVTGGNLHRFTPGLFKRPAVLSLTR